MAQVFGKQMEHTPEDWGLSIADFEKGGWGTSNGKFVVPASIIRAFRTPEQILDQNGDPVLDNEGNETFRTVFDKDRAFSEMCYTFINAILTTNEQMLYIPFYSLDPVNQSLLRKCVYNSIEFSSLKT